MGEPTRQIEVHIEHTRQDLGSNLQELEQKFKSVTDWKHHFRTSPMTMLGVAFGGGVVLATMFGGRRRKRRERGFSGHAIDAERLATTGHHKQKSLETWDYMKRALLGVAATRLKDFAGQVVPGFHEQYQRNQDKAAAIQPLAR